MKTYSRLKTVTDNGVARITMVSPTGVNTMNIDLAQQLLSAICECSEAAEIRAVILDSEGKVFCAGGDLGELSAGISESDHTLEPFVDTLAKLVRQIRKCPKPVIAAVHGGAAGSGCNLALACDMVIADEKAKFIEAFVNIGLAPDTAGAFLLPQMIGNIRAFELLATGRPVKAEEAERIGLVNKVVPEAALEEEAMQYARRFACGPATAYAGIKEMLYVQTFSEYDEFTRVEIAAQNRCEKTEDFREGVRAFLERRTPEFTGK